MADLPTAGDDIGGYRLLQPLPGHDPAVARWSARSLQGPAELFVGGAPLLRQARGLPGWGPFPPLAWGEQQGFAFVAVPGRLAQDLPALGRRLAPGACLALAWHVVAAVAELHENGGAHGALASGFVGLDEVGRLAIRPALDGSAPADPDPSATAQATDCLALGQLLDVLRVELIDDAAVGLLLSGLRRERARLRLSPGRAVRQAMAALLARHPAFELALIGELGPAFSLARLPTAPPPARPRPQATPSWERQEEEPIRAPAQVFLGQAPRPSPPLASPPAAPTWTDDEPGPTDDAQDGAAHDETPAEAPAETPAEALDDEAVRDEDTSLEPVPEHVAADIVEEVAPLEAESGAWMAVGAHIAGREEVPGDLPGGQTLAPEEVEALLSSDVGGGATLAPDEFPELLPPQAHEATQDPATEATIDTSLGLGEELSSAMVGVVAPSHARDEIPSQALQIVPVPQPARLDLDDESAELDLQAEREAAEQAEREAAEQAEREAAEQAEREAAEQAEREAAEQAEREARARAEQEARARAEQEARAQAEQEARAQ
ncbi:hypothetical protein L6R53_10995, partial [Myxococcota bacterium]|nr:hypothetical protein [Myxococcota bacterium]